MSRYGLVSVSDDGRILACDPDVFIARFVDGVWERNKMFSTDDLKDNFNPVLDEAEAKRLINEAKASLLK